VTWLRHTDRPPVSEPHDCALPYREVCEDNWLQTEPDGEHGDLWLCDDCGAIWIVHVDDCFGARFSDWRRVFWRAWWYRRKYLEKN
jgi:hypothetical protein